MHRLFLAPRRYLGGDRSSRGRESRSSLLVRKLHYTRE